jgi:hypothetical protein
MSIMGEFLNQGVEKMRSAKSSIAYISCAIVATFGVLASTASFALPTVSMNVYEEQANATCTNTATCRVDFSTVATPLKITKVSCNVYNSQTNTSQVSFTGAVLGKVTGVAPGVFADGQYLAPIEPFLWTPTLEQYQILVDTLHVIAAHAKPSVRFNFDHNTNATVNCTISGNQ